MTDLEKARYILELLNSKKFEVEGIQEAFRLTQSYSWLFTVAKQLEEKSNKPKNQDKK